MSEKIAINEYLFYEFGYDLQYDPSAIAENWPFELQTLGTLHSEEGEIEVFGFFAKGRAYVVLWGSTLTFYPAAGMTLKDLQLQHNGMAWISRQDPIDLATSRLGDDETPSVSERQTTLDELASGVCISPEVRLGLYLCRTGIYLGLVDDVQSGTTMLVGTSLSPRAVAFPKASTWRRLALGIGTMLQEGIL